MFGVVKKTQKCFYRSRFICYNCWSNIRLNVWVIAYGFASECSLFDIYKHDSVYMSHHIARHFISGFINNFVSLYQQKPDSFIFRSSWRLIFFCLSTNPVFILFVQLHYRHVGGNTQISFLWLKNHLNDAITAI